MAERERVDSLVAWSASVRPLLAASYASFDASDVPQLVASILKSAKQILNHDKQYEPFYSSFAALSAHYITTAAKHIPSANAQGVCAACKVLLEFFLLRVESPDEACAVSQKHLILLIKALCTGNSQLDRTELITFTAMMTSARLPLTIKTLSEAEEQKEPPPPLSPEEAEKEARAAFFQQLGAVTNFDLPRPVSGFLGVPERALDEESAPEHAASSKSKAHFVASNIASLQELGGSEKLLRVCLNLPYFLRYINRFHDAVSSASFFLMPATVTDATAVRNGFHSLIVDVTIALDTLCLPILEPLTPSRLQSLTLLALSCLYAGVSVATCVAILHVGAGGQSKGSTSSKDEEYEEEAGTIVRKCLEIYDTVGQAISNSRRAGGEHFQNYQLLGAWCLLSSLHIVAGLTPAALAERGKEKDPLAALRVRDTTGRARDGAGSPKLLPGKGHSGFGVLMVMLANHAVGLVRSLLDDVRLQTLDKDGPSPGPVAELNVMAKSTPVQRVQRLIETVPLTCLFFTILSIAYRKACALQRQRKGSICSDGSTSTDSNTFYEEDFSSSDDDSSQDEDSEPILGQWFEETISPSKDRVLPTSAASTAPPPAPPPPLNLDGTPGGTSTTAVSTCSPSKGGPGENGNMLTWNKDPEMFLGLATNILTFLTSSLFTAKTNFVRNYVSVSLCEAHLSQLACLLRDVDKDTARRHSGAEHDFVSALSRFSHSMLTADLLSPALQNQLLGHLGVLPQAEGPWPLAVPPLALGLLGRVILQRQEMGRTGSAREMGRSSSGRWNDSLLIWERFIESLRQQALQPVSCSTSSSSPSGPPAAVPSAPDIAQEDVSVDHVQLLLLLFHGLSPSGRRHVARQLLRAVCEAARASTSLPSLVPLGLARLTLLLEYFLLQYSRPQPSLYTQVQGNLFMGSSAAGGADAEGGGGRRGRIYHPCREVEESWSKCSGGEGSGAKCRARGRAPDIFSSPRFYNLLPSEVLASDSTKLDSQMLEVFNAGPYSELYEACILLLGAGSRLDGIRRQDKKTLSPLEACSIQYSFLVTWRLLGKLPPPEAYLESLAAPSLPLDGSEACLLHWLRWSSRLASENYTTWLQAQLELQGMLSPAAAALIQRATVRCKDFPSDVSVLESYFCEQVNMYGGTVSTLSNQPPVLPGVYAICALDAALAKAQVALDTGFGGLLVGASSGAAESCRGLLLCVLQLVEIYVAVSRWYLLGSLVEEGGSGEASYPPDNVLRSYAAAMALGNGRSGKTGISGPAAVPALPAGVRSLCESWNAVHTTEFPSMGAWRNAFAKDIVPAESYVCAVQTGHMTSLGNQNLPLAAPLKHTLASLTRLATDLLVWCPEVAQPHGAATAFLPLLLAAEAESLSESATHCLESVLGPAEGEPFLYRVHSWLISITYALLTHHSGPSGGLSEEVLEECICFLERGLQSSMSRRAMEEFFTNSGELAEILLVTAGEHLSVNYCNRILRFLTTLLTMAERTSEMSLQRLAGSLAQLVCAEPARLRAWLSRMAGSGLSAALTGESEPTDAQRENRHLLLGLASCIARENSPVGEGVCTVLLSAMVQMAGEMVLGRASPAPFPDLLNVMATLANAGQGAGHLQLHRAAVAWLASCKTYLSSKNVVEKCGANVTQGKHQVMLEAACQILSYLSDVLSALRVGAGGPGPPPVPPEGEERPGGDGDSDWAEDLAADDDDSHGEDSDEDSLCNKLCTFTITQKEFMNQHWYHCHTCKMVDGVGVCTVCAKVCHRDHEVSYAKYGSFFCDCGAKDDGTCQALLKRSPTLGLSSGVKEPGPFTTEMRSGGSTAVTEVSARHRVASSATSSERAGRGGGSTSTGYASEGRAGEEERMKKRSLCWQVEGCRAELTAQVTCSGTAQTVLELLNLLLEPIKQSFQQASAAGTSRRAQAALHTLHSASKICEFTDQLMVPTLGSQEGAFENVRMSYSGEQGQTIRQLLSAHVLRRVAMCVLSSPHGRRQHLAVSHEKGKITVLQLSTLLKQADTSKRKLTLTRLASAPVPFTVLSLSGNPCNEDYLAVCGLKDCHVLTFGSSGSVSDHLVLHPQLTTGNFIIKALWLPGSQTELAVVTSDFIKVYDLSVDALSPSFFFLLPSSKVRDATFVCGDDGRHLLIMASSGYVYVQCLEEASGAQHGPFYVTNCLEITHEDLKDGNGQVAGGGASIYYSHCLQLLMLSYGQGRCFAATLALGCLIAVKLFPITLKSSNGGSGSKTPPVLCQWAEVPGHPGLLCCVQQATGTPVIIMVRPETFLLQEIRALPAKAKIQDLVAIRHSACGEQQRTTMIVLCEDGSLRIYTSSTEHTSFWLQPALQPTGIVSILKPVRKRKATVIASRSMNQVTFPIDFFEHNQQLGEVEFGGGDLLQVYHVAQLKHRLNTSGLYIASTKPGGFNLEVSNPSQGTVMTGLRIQAGSQGVERAPAHLEVFGRTVPLSLARPRWFDVPFTRDEALQADKKFNVFIGPSADAAGVTMIDSIKIYGKTKEAFGWPDDPPDEFPGPTSAAAVSGSPGLGVNGQVGVGILSGDPEGTGSVGSPTTSLDRLVVNSFQALEHCFAVMPANEKEKSKAGALELTTLLLFLPSPSSVQLHTKALLACLYTSRTAYHNHKDKAQLRNVILTLELAQSAGQSPDPETFHRLVVAVRGIAVSRPANLLRFAEPEQHVSKSTENETEGDKDGTARTSIEAEAFEKVRLGPNKPGDEMEASESGQEGLVRSWVEHESGLVAQLMESFWHLHAAKPQNAFLAPACLPGLTHIEGTVNALVDIVHGFTSCELDFIPSAARHYVRLLLCPDPAVSFACKQALVRVLRPRNKRRHVTLPSPPRSNTPTGDKDDDDEDDEETEEKVASGVRQRRAARRPGGRHGSQEQNEADFELVSEAMVLESSEGGSAVGASPLEALLAGAEGFPPSLDIPPDADDETMVELAIALSLQQDQQGGGGNTLRLQSLGLPGQGQSSSSLDAGTLSDTTASAPASDDEGSTLATDGSTLRTSPAEHAGSAGSESGGSAVDSVTGEQNASGRSSAYGDGGVEVVAARGPGSVSSSTGAISTTMGQPEDPGSDPEPEPEAGDVGEAGRLHIVRLILLEQLLLHLDQVRSVGGVQAIPFMQVVLMLSSDLDSEAEKDRGALDNLLSRLVAELAMDKKKDATSFAERSPTNEVILVILRLLSVFMSRTKSSSRLGAEGSLISSSTANALLDSGAVDHCLCVLRSLLEYWRGLQIHEDPGTGGTAPRQLLRPHAPSPPPDMSPFFLRQYVKGHAADVFEAYPQLLTEMALRLPYQMKKIADADPAVAQPVFDQAWFYFLCEYLMTQQTPFVRRQVRKLLLFICGSKEKYRQLRDLHALESHVAAIRRLLASHPTPDSPAPVMQGQSPATAASLRYDSLIALMEHLKMCADVASQRTVNWQKFCLKDETVLSFLLQASFLLDEGVSPVLLQLLTSALCGNKTQIPQSSLLPNQTLPDGEGEAAIGGGTTGGMQEEQFSDMLVQQLCREVQGDTLARFVQAFLLESNSSAVRWQAHCLLLNIYRSSVATQQEQLLDVLWALWSKLPVYGHRATHFVDLLGYCSLHSPHTSEKKFKSFTQKAVDVLHTQNHILANHPNSNIYNMLSGLVEFDGYYLESDPCLVCNNPEVPFSNIKLSSIKVDTRYTTTQQVVKLVGSYTIARVTLKISDLKRAKMVRTVNLFYNNRTVQSIVELKNKPSSWHKAKKVTLTAGQPEVKIDLPLPIVASNLMVEFADFYENVHASSETLQCPRCSASVPANPGVCGNCGENVYQCHKCRSINYDEKDPFLCNACGFCKYGKFELTLLTRSCCAVDPIENEDDRKKAVSNINSLLERADHVYHQLMGHRPQLEELLTRVREAAADKTQDEAVSGAVPSGVPGGQAFINKHIQALAQKYCGDCKVAFDELSKILQKVLASRKELVEYDAQQHEVATRSSRTTPTPTPTQTPTSPPSNSLATRSPGQSTASSRCCYGCSAAVTEHCVTLLRALATNIAMRNLLVEQGLLRELFEWNLRRGPAGLRSDVRRLMCLLSRDNPEATEQLNGLIVGRVSDALRGHWAHPNLASSVCNEMLLLTDSISSDDSCWEQRLRCVLSTFLLAVNVQSPAVIQSVALPCLTTLQRLVNPPPPTSLLNKEKPMESLCSVKLHSDQLHAQITPWLKGDARASFEVWKHSLPSRGESCCGEVRQRFLQEKYGRRWLDAVAKKGRVGRCPPLDLRLGHNNWLRQMLFTPASQAARQAACCMLESLGASPARSQHVLDLLTSYLSELSSAGECAAEYLCLYQKLIRPPHWKMYLAAREVLPLLGTLITREIAQLLTLEDATLTSDLQQGYALKMLTELLSSFVEVDSIKRKFKGRLVGTVLNGYLCLRKLVVQRSKLIDETQDVLLDMLEDMTTGTESETRAFMAVCIDTARRYSLDDYRTPVFIFERLCSVIYPEENDIPEFLVSLEKDAQQEDFLQGRMPGNPYGSQEPGLGPLMRDIKNKICRDCDLVALLEDDSGMELLVNNKIISLDLPVAEVYKKVWSPTAEGDSMRIVYRMRGLLGDATEEFIETLDSAADEEEDEEEVYRMAGVMAECGGLDCILTRLAGVKDFKQGRQLLTVLLKLLGFCVKVRVNRRDLARPGASTLNVLLATLNLALLAEQESSSSGGAAIAEQVLSIMETILDEANAEPASEERGSPVLSGEREQLEMLLQQMNSTFVRSKPSVQQGVLRILPCLAFGERDKMLILLNRFKPCCDFDRYDEEHSAEEQAHLDCFCRIAVGIKNSAPGRQLKDLILSSDIVQGALRYLESHIPADKNIESDVWKGFLSRPALPFVVKLLTGLATQHPPTQAVISEKAIPWLHQLEQVSSEEGIGTLAENLLEALRSYAEARRGIEAARRETRAEKKRLAMAMRQKALGTLGMTTNEKGQVVTKTTMLKQMEELIEEPGLTCCICREGYKFQQTKVLGIYTFTKRVPLEEFETKSRKQQGYSTVCHFNIIHYDCHLAAVRLARGREEWESAALQNANTKCNGLLPLWGPSVPESAFATCLARHNTYLQESTGQREPSYQLSVHDLKLLLLRFATEQSFSSDTGGGGRQSNLNLAPYLVHTALYVMNTTRTTAREDKAVQSFLESGPESWVENSFEVEGPLYYAVLALHVLPPSAWLTNRIFFLRRLLVLAHARHCSPSGCTRLSDATPLEFGVYRPALLFWGMIHLLYDVVFQRAPVRSSEGGWPFALAEYIRYNDVVLLEGTEKALRALQDQFMPAGSLSEFLGAVGLNEEIANADSFLQDLLASVP
uniref:E3 ubiquitin-protein ligase UBR4 n=1 Tax=Myxine glutinosa TaxID=7769 RepID=UPI00358DF698